MSNYFGHLFTVDAMRLERKTSEYAYRLMTETNACSKGTLFLKGMWYVRLVRAFYVGPNVACASIYGQAFSGTRLTHSAELTTGYIL